MYLGSFRFLVMLFSIFCSAWCRSFCCCLRVVQTVADLLVVRVVFHSWCRRRHLGAFGGVLDGAWESLEASGKHLVRAGSVSKHFGTPKSVWECPGGFPGPFLSVGERRRVLWGRLGAFESIWEHRLRRCTNHHHHLYFHIRHHHLHLHTHHHHNIHLRSRLHHHGHGFTWEFAGKIFNAGIFHSCYSIHALLYTKTCSCMRVNSVVHVSRSKVMYVSMLAYTMA